MGPRGEEARLGRGGCHSRLAGIKQASRGAERTTGDKPLAEIVLQFTVKVCPPKTPGRMFHLSLLHQLLNRDALFDVDNGDTSCYFMLAFSVRVRDGFA